MVEAVLIISMFILLECTLQTVILFSKEMNDKNSVSVEDMNNTLEDIYNYQLQLGKDLKGEIADARMQEAGHYKMLSDNLRDLEAQFAPVDLPMCDDRDACDIHPLPEIPTTSLNAAVKLSKNKKKGGNA